MHQLFLELAKDLCARTHRLRTPFSRILASVRIASTSRTKLLRHVQHGRGVTWANALGTREYQDRNALWSKKYQGSEDLVSSIVTPV